MEILVLAAAVAILILGVLGTPLIQVYLALKPYRLEYDTTPEDYNMDYKEIEFQGAEKIKLRGWFIPAEEETDKTVIVCHGHPFNRGKVLPKVDYLQKRYNLFLYDLRYFGKSQGRYTTLGKKESKDLEKAVEFLKENTGTEKVAVYGFSLSAATVLLSENRDVEAVIADSPFCSLEKLAERIYPYLPGKTKRPFIKLIDYYLQRFFDITFKEIKPEETVKKIDKPVLLIHGTKDLQIPYTHSEKINRNMKNSELWKVKGARHVRSYEKTPERYREKVEEFLTEHL